MESVSFFHRFRRLFIGIFLTGIFPVGIFIRIFTRIFLKGSPNRNLPQRDCLIGMFINGISSSESSSMGLPHGNHSQRDFPIGIFLNGIFSPESCLTHQDLRLASKVFDTTPQILPPNKMIQKSLQYNSICHSVHIFRKVRFSADVKPFVPPTSPFFLCGNIQGRLDLYNARKQVI